VLVVGRETKDNFNLMINKLLESIYSKTFLGSRSLSGGCNKKSKNDASNTELNKPGLPDDDLNEIIIEQSKDFIPKHCKLCFHFIILVDRVFQRYSIVQKNPNAPLFQKPSLMYIFCFKHSSLHIMCRINCFTKFIF
jgi:hypothetical protein